MGIKIGNIASYEDWTGERRFCVVRDIRKGTNGVRQIWGIWRYKSIEHALTHEFENNINLIATMGWMGDDEIRVESISYSVRLFVEE